MRLLIIGATGDTGLQWGRLLSALIRDFGDFDLAEEVLQEAFASASVEWTAGAPTNPFTIR